MRGERKTKEQLVLELTELRHRFVELEKAKAKSFEVSLKESEEKYRLLVEASTDMIFTVDLKGNFIFTNRAFKKNLGYSVEEIKKINGFKLIHPEDLAVVIKQFTQLVEGKSVDNMEYRYRTKDGFYIHILNNAAPIFDSQGKVVAAFGVARNITQRKRMEEELLKAHDKLEHRVKERTRELRRINKQLMHEITKRKRAQDALHQSYKKLRKTLDETVIALASTVEIRDPYTAGHQQNVTNLAYAIAKEMGLSEDKIEGTRTAGAVHDVGKIQVPAEILSKPGQITKIEFDIIKTHPQISHDILKSIEFPWPIAQIVLQHHERMDGSGYPNGLSGKQILIEARILAVADVVEAMSSFRPYRPALGIERALGEIKKNRGRLYDPEVVNACVKLFSKKGFRF